MTYKVERCPAVHQPQNLANKLEDTGSIATIMNGEVCS